MSSILDTIKASVAENSIGKKRMPFTRSVGGTERNQPPAADDAMERAMMNKARMQKMRSASGASNKMKLRGDAGRDEKTESPREKAREKRLGLP